VIASPATIVRALRLPFTTASLLPYVYGSLLPEGAFRPLPFALGLTAAVCTHLAANLANDFADSASGADDLDPTYYGFFGGSKLIQEGRLTPRFYRNAAVGFALAATAAAAGLASVLGRPEALFLFGAVLFLAFSYSCRPLRLAYRSLGEAAVLVLFGPVAVVAGAYAQTGSFPSPGVWLLSLPFGLLTAAILLANEVPDAREDAAVGKRNLVAWTGPARAFRLFAALVTAAYLAILAAIALGLAGPLAMAALATLPLAWWAGRVLRDGHEVKPQLLRSSRMTIILHTTVSLALIADVLASRAGAWPAS